MADQFLSKTRVSADDFVEAGGRAVLERYGELRALLAERAGPEAAALFAEPLISRGNDAAPATVSWYADGAGAGEVRPLDDLPADERARAEAWLADHLRPLRPLAEDPATADLVLGALSVMGAGDVVVIDGRPVIVNWGLMPGARGANAAARPAHYVATLGRFLPLPAVRPADAAPIAAGAAGAAAPVSPAPPAASPGSPSHRLSPWAWAPLLVLLILAGAVLVWLLMPGTRIFPRPQPAAVTDADRLAAQRALNDSLRARRDQLQAALEGAVCRPDGALILPDGRTPDGLLPPPAGTPFPRKAEAAPDALLPSRPDRVVLPSRDAAGQEETLLEWIEARTVLVLVLGPEGLVVGSGMSVGPGLILTNQHVIAGAGEGGIVVAGGGLSAPQAAQVIRQQGPLEETGADFALLRIGDTGLPAFGFYRPEGSMRLQQVIAAGYPGDALEMDADFAALKAGRAGAMPGLTVTDGIVNAEQKIGPETSVIMHSAPLSAGNSGGPLVDMCGRVVGLNSFVRKGRLQNRGYALPAASILDFLDGTEARPEVDTAPCAPTVIVPQPAAAPARAVDPAAPAGGGQGGN